MMRSEQEVRDMIQTIRDRIDRLPDIVDYQQTIGLTVFRSNLEVLKWVIGETDIHTMRDREIMQNDDLGAGGR
jgi:hypothetical protein